MTYTVDEVVGQHRKLTAAVATIAARHAEELKPYQESLKAIEAWLLAKMQEEGVQNYKTPHGTAYQTTLRSVKMDNPVLFRDFILRPAAAQIQALVSGSALFADRDSAIDSILSLLGTLPLWDLADFRPGNKNMREDKKY